MPGTEGGEQAPSEVQQKWAPSELRQERAWRGAGEVSLEETAMVMAWVLVE